MKIRLLSSAASVVALLSVITSPVAFSAAHGDMIAEGKRIAFDRKLGNCLTCHVIAGGQAAGNLGPPLIAMKARFPDKNVLRSQIWDSTVKNPATPMPPFGRHNILTEKQIDLVTEYILTL
ncbi:MAG: sulfur oxidation c-type cytochrome SoxX [Gammaproteobacteria bacterium]|nr:sulfur oxidation c-type cytochrome SoxX [Gammaproteobacteria bacterium]MBL6998882.1 sulfur oxidation c-type cytochrome SoxX [Gammaproteobacteria bacterium]